jgi:serine/threonine-protein phosphatase PGAM5
MKRILVVLLSLFVSATVQAADASQPAARTLLLVRHGHYVEDPSVDARLGPGLSPIGVAQAHLAGARLAGMPPFDALFVSPMQRARDTAAVIGVNFPGRRFTVVDDLAECTPPTRRTEITKDETPADLTACKARLDRVFATYFKPASGAGSTELFVCMATSSATSSRARSGSIRPRGWKCRSGTQASRRSAWSPMAASR